MKKYQALITFGIYLLFAGVAGFLSNPEKAKTALLSGGLFGTLCILCGVFLKYQKKGALQIGLALCTLLSLVFTWRSSAGWLAVANGNSEKIFAASLITSMLVGALFTLKALLKKA